MKTIESIAAMYRSHELSPVEYVKDLIDRIECNRELLAFVSVDEEGALQQARRAEQKLMSGESSDCLLGIPVGVKDVIDVRGLPTTAGCCALVDNYSAEDAPVVRKLRERGAIVIGKTTPHQLAFGITGDCSHIGAPKNPFDSDRITGGSSGGSACAVAAGLCDAALGTDTGGSVRVPAACCGIVGMKPTAGSIDRTGIYPLSRTLDCVGTMSRTVRDNELLLEATSDYQAGKESDIGGMRAAVPADMDALILDPEIQTAFETCMSLLVNAGVRISRVALPELGEYKKARRCIQMHEAYQINRSLIMQKPPVLNSEILERFNRYSYDQREYQMALTMVSAAQKLFMELLGDNHMFILPAIPILPTKIGQREICVEGTQYSCISLLTKFMWQANLTGFPAMSIPIGISKEKLPIAMQMVGSARSEAFLYRMGRWLEKELGVTDRLMDLSQR